MNPTRRQHYVWRKYLEGWAINGLVAVARKSGSVFQASPMNIGHQRDFYRLPVLSIEDENFAKKFISFPGTNQDLLKLNMGWLNIFSQPSRIRRLIEKKGAIDEAQERIIREIEIQTEESLHSEIEGPAAPLLMKLRSGDAEFWNVDNDARRFAFFLAVQHLRTKAMRERVLQRTESRILGHVERTWPIIRMAFATNLGWSLYSDRARWHIRVLSASEELRFITGDQPILNLLPLTGRDDDLALYYPLSPDKAALFELRDANSPVGAINQLTDAVVDNLNRQIIDGIHEQAFGSEPLYLSQLIDN